jgi:mannosyltransferase OCH1-like enzyme
MPEIVHGMWIGNHLSLLELLCLHSFTAKGHSFHLWTYEALDNTLPTGVVLNDANEIIPKEQVFSYKNRNSFGHGKGSYAGFSDIFRYKLLYDKGGWWVDMDITCLKAFDFSQDYFFRAHHDLTLVGNVMKCPQGSALMLSCYEEAMKEVTAENTDWHKPINILVNNVKRLGLESYIFSGLSNEDRWDHTEAFIWKMKPIPENFYFMHWQNEEWRNRGISKESLKYQSTLGSLLYQYGLIAQKLSLTDILDNSIRFSRLARNLRLLGIID